MTPTPDLKATLLLNDTFTADVARGQVIGSQSPDGRPRLGTDAEGLMSVDNGALRIPPLIEAGWGRASLAYGPFPRQPGLTVAVSMLNGHNTSQLDEFTDTVKRRLWRWAHGSLSPSESRVKLVPRMLRWATSAHLPRMVWWLRWWRKLRSIAGTQILLDENMAVGWFDQPIAAGKLPNGNAFVMHALGGANGELWAHGGKAPLPTVSGYQNIPTQYVVVLRERGAAYYAASLTGAFGVGSYPHLRPLAVEPFRADPQVYAGVQQSVLGQIGFRADTRVSGVKVGQVDAWSQWYGSAHCADRLSGTGELAETNADTGEAWTLVSGGWQRGAHGALGVEADNRTLITAQQPAGLIHTLITTGADRLGTLGVIWRAVDGDNYWSLCLSAAETQLVRTTAGQAEVKATTTDVHLRPNSTYAVQILDDGHTIAAFVDGQLVFGERLAAEHFNTASGIGLLSQGSDARFRDFEAHPRSVEIPAQLAFATPWQRSGQRMVVTEQFDGAARELEGKPTTSGGQVWQRTRGSGVVDLLGDGTAHVRATSAQPNPGRTLFTVAWAEPGFAELEAIIRPPEQRASGDQKGRCGVVFWQDINNYLVVSTYLDSWHPTSSISSFFHINGFEEVYDAIWTNLDRHVMWGQDYRLRVAFDGRQYLVRANDEPVLYRALTDVYPRQRPLTINRVGLAVNWEWGDDTGSVLKQFVAKASS